jgi:hypothetical protein
MDPEDVGKKSDARRARLSASLRENLKRRKVQKRSRAAAPAPAAAVRAFTTPRESKD